MPHAPCRIQFARQVSSHSIILHVYCLKELSYSMSHRFRHLRHGKVSNSLALGDLAC